MPKIKLNFEGEEKILPEDPKSFSELYNLFQKLFLREQNDNNYIFCLDKEKTNSIDIGNFTEKIQEIKNMKEPKIYVGIKDYIELNNRSVNVTVLLNDDNKQNVEGYNENIEQNNNFDFNLVKESKSIELSKINNSGDLNNNYGEIVEIMEKEIKNTKNILDKEINRMEILNENLDILYCLDDLIRKNKENNNKIKTLEKENKEYLKKNEELLKKINSYENEDKVQLIEKIIKLEKEIEKYKNNMINIFKDEDDNNKNNENKIKELENKIKEKDEIIKNMTKKNNEDLEKLGQLHSEKKLLENINKEKQIQIISLDKENKEKSNKINNLNNVLDQKENQMKEFKNKANEEKKQLMEKFQEDKNLIIQSIQSIEVKFHQKSKELDAKIENILVNLCNNIK